MAYTYSPLTAFPRTGLLFTYIGQTGREYRPDDRLQTPALTPVVQVEIVNEGGKPAAAATVTSLQVAEAFGKEHQNVLVDIRNILESDDFTALNFQASEYRDSTGRFLPMFILSRDKPSGG